MVKTSKSELSLVKFHIWMQFNYNLKSALYYHVQIVYMYKKNSAHLMFTVMDYTAQTNVQWMELYHFLISYHLCTVGCS